MTYDAVIVGSGVAGLSAALLLAKHGRRVALIEKDRQAAPLLSGFSRQGLHCETGFHFTGMLGPGLPLHRFLRYLGVLDYVVPVSIPQMDGAQIIFTDGQAPVYLPWGRDELAHALRLRFLGEEKAIAGYLSAINQELDNIPFFSLKPRKSFPVASTQSLTRHLSQLSNNKELHMALGLRCALHGVPPEDISFTMHARVEGSFQLSSHSLQGGGKALANAMLKQLQQYEVDVFTGCAVEEIHVKGRAVEGLALASGRRIASGICLFTPHPALLPAMLGNGALRPAYGRRLANLPETRAPFIVYGAIPASAAEFLANRAFFICPQDTISKCMTEQNPNNSMICVSVAPPANNMCALSIMTAMEPRPFTAGGDHIHGPRSNYYHDLK